MFPFIDPSGYLLIAVAIGFIWLAAWIGALIAWNMKNKQ